MKKSESKLVILAHILIKYMLRGMQKTHDYTYTYYKALSAYNATVLIMECIYDQRSHHCV